jgi:transketolase
MSTITELEKTASQVRRDIVRMVHACQSGHPGGSLGCADFITALYFEVMKHDNKFNMDGKNEDLFFLSNGHISPVWYSVLARSGYFPVAEIARSPHYRRTFAWGSCGFGFLRPRLIGCFGCSSNKKT